MNCEDAQKFVHVYLDGEFAEEDRDAFEEHLSRCDDCQAMVQFEKRFKAAIKTAVTDPPLPAGLEERIHAALQGESESTEASKWWTWGLRLAPVGLAAGLLLFLAWPTAHHRVQQPSNMPDQATMAAGVIRPVPDSPTAYHPVAYVPSRSTTGSGYAVQQASFDGMMRRPSRPRVSVRVIAPKRVSTDGLMSRWVNGRKVYFGMQGGRNVALFEYNGVGYAVSADVPQEELAEIVRSLLDR
ncbi:MAG: zf-HC2 domain-containing protein [Deltaproteobacteria bacterium]|nr:zf-HC2 domain-containing protein [Deltaproteobacteria bacterium]